MRNAFAEILTRLGAADHRVMLLSGDIGNRLFEPFKAACPGRFLNCGVAEANMIGVAAGLAMQGLRPVCYTIAPFLTYRCLEQIRTDLCYQGQAVTLVGTGGGLAYAELGATHQACEEMGMLRLLPNLRVAAPADRWELEALLTDALSGDAPAYLRIGKKGEPPIHTRPPPLAQGRGTVLRAGTRAALLACGPILGNVLAAAESLGREGLRPTVVSLPSLKPLDEGLLAELARGHELWVSVEEHSLLGGLGGALAEWIGSQPEGRPRLRRLGTGDEFPRQVTDQAEARRRWSLDPAGIARAVRTALEELRP
jgi:transketolase